MNCPTCKSDKVYIKQTRTKELSTTRRIHCENCGERFTTIETITRIGGDIWSKGNFKSAEVLK